VIVVPLRIGTGTRLKALEAMAAGRAVVGTAVGLGGLGLEPGRQALVGDTPPALAAAVVDCLSDAALAARLGGAARTLVEGRYAWSAIGAGYVELVLRRLGDRRVAPRRGEA
jgi:glycosyltransferase involved in cell wall biosynthesis